MRRAQAAEGRVGQEVDVVVPAEELAVERGQEGQDGQRGDAERRQSPPAARRDRRCSDWERRRRVDR
jgi:hypothetical protein